VRGGKPQRVAEPNRAPFQWFGEGYEGNRPGRKAEPGFGQLVNCRLIHFLMGFSLSLLLILLFVRYVLPALLRAVLGGFVRQQVHKAQQAAGRGASPFGSPPPPAPPGQVRVEYVPPPAPKPQPKASFEGGEYVDYEEV